MKGVNDEMCGGYFTTKVNNNDYCTVLLIIIVHPEEQSIEDG